MNNAFTEHRKKGRALRKKPKSKPKIIDFEDVMKSGYVHLLKKSVSMESEDMRLWQENILELYEIDKQK